MKSFPAIARNIAKVMRLLAGGHAAELRYQLWNKWKRVDYEAASVEDLGLSPERAHFHSSSGGPVLARVFGSLAIPRGSVALDLGSGKGSAVFTLSSLGFAEVVGVELSSELIAIAERNAFHLGCRNARFIQADAALFNDYDRVTHIYMYNPFPCAVLSQVIANLEESLKRLPRSMTIVYRNPLCHDAIVASALFDAGPEQRSDEHVWRVYRSRPL